MARVGYLEGTDPLLLSTLAAEGVETLPVSNTLDGHGKPINHLSKGEVNVVVGYLHKVIPNEQARTSMFELVLDSMLGACKAYGIPVLLIAPAKLHDKAKKLLGESRSNVHVVAPDELEAQIRKYL
jgi:hypothetical protein